MTKARIFIDYWNFQLSVLEIKGDRFRLDWKKISPWLIDALQGIISFKVDLKAPASICLTIPATRTTSDCGIGRIISSTACQAWM